ncbi:hypothetical protein [Laceyella putida]|uniref:Uncharacterized protein n=1 Tax=Laceyella putida TaxID=110101 RepID=A0ABW2RLX6_9BACL
MLYDDDHLDFEVKLKRYVHLEVLLEALNRDKKQLGHLKFAEVYEDQIDHISDQILKDMAELRRYFRQSQGEIIQTVQLVGERMVEYVWKGYRLNMKFLNEFMKVECGEILKGYMKIRRGDLT